MVIHTHTYLLLKTQLSLQAHMHMLIHTHTIQDSNLTLEPKLYRDKLKTLVIREMPNQNDEL